MSLRLDRLTEVVGHGILGGMGRAVVVVALLAALALGAAVGFASINGAFHPWHEFPLPAGDDAVRLSARGEQGAYVETTRGEVDVTHVDQTALHRWREYAQPGVAAVLLRADGRQTSWPPLNCTSDSEPAFRWSVVRQPRQAVTDQVYCVAYGLRQDQYETFALLEDGSVWWWRTYTPTFESALIVCYWAGVFGAATFIVVAVAYAAARRREDRAS